MHLGLFYNCNDQTAAGLLEITFIMMKGQLFTVLKTYLLTVLASSQVCKLVKTLSRAQTDRTLFKGQGSALPVWGQMFLTSPHI